MRKSILPVFLLLTFLITPLAQAKQKSHWLKGGIIGGSVGAGVSLAGTVPACAIGDSFGVDTGTSVRCYSILVPSGIIIVGGIGFGIGALIGDAFKKDVAVTPYADPKSGSYGASLTSQF